MASPGQSVRVPSRWPDTARSVTTLPAAYFGFPPDVIWVVDRGSTCARSRRHEISETSAWRAASVSAVLSPSPMYAMPTLPVLNPSVWAPTTLLVIPP